LDEPDGGSVTVGGQRLTRRSEIERADLRARNYGILLQSGNLFEHLSVADNLRLAQRLANKIDEDLLGELLDQLGIQARRNHRPSALSGGEAARAGLAVALSTRPALLVADEPSGEVDRANEGLLVDRLLQYQRDGGTVIVATHSEALAKQADRILRLSDGKVLND
jgi:putative ABC transport system ATP-binding protein